MQENIAVISLKNIKSNLVALQKILPRGVKTYAVVKANAYGHGIERVAESIQERVDGLVVTSVREGIILRTSGCYQPILVLTPPLDTDDVFWAVHHRLTVTVCSFASLNVLVEGARRYHCIVNAHVKVDTGMNRLGLRGKEVRKLFVALSRARSLGVDTTGIYSHLYAPENEACSIKQRDEFADVTAVAQDVFGERLICHLSATGGTIRGGALGGDFFFDGVRLGIGLYGYLPNGLELAARERSVKLRPAMKLYTHILQSHPFTGDGVGYREANAHYKNLTAYRLGYADGLFRACSGGGNLNAIGNLCMDSCLCESNLKRGYGDKKLVFASVENLAKRAGSIPYEILCNATKRAELVYVE